MYRHCHDHALFRANQILKESHYNYTLLRKWSVFGVCLIRIFPYSDGTQRQRDTEKNSRRTRKTPNKNIFHAKRAVDFIPDTEAKPFAVSNY